MYRLERQYGLPIEGSCTTAVNNTVFVIDGNLCGLLGVQVLPLLTRNYRFSLRDAKTDLLLEQVNICDDRSSEMLPEGFVYNPPAEEF